MKRIALAVAVVVMAAGACKKAQNNTTSTDSTQMADSMKMAPGDTTHRMGDTTKMAADTTKARPDTAHRTTTRTRRP